MAFRLRPSAVATETTSTVSVNLPASGSAGFTAFAPSQAQGRAIVGVQIKALGTVTLSLSGSAGNVLAALLAQFKVTYGSQTLINATSAVQFAKIVHILTGTDLADATMSTGTSSTATADTGVIPLQFLTGTAPQFFLYANTYSGITNATGGTLAITLVFYYASSSAGIVNDYVEIINPGVSLSTGTDIDVRNYITSKDPVNELWVDLTTDASLTYQTFKFGNTTIFDQMTPSALKAVEQYLGGSSLEASVNLLSAPGAQVFSHVAGFLKMAQPRGIVYQQQAGAATTLPKMILNLGTARTPIFYLVH